MPFTDRRPILRAAATLPVFAGLTSGTASAQATSTEAQRPAAAPRREIEKQRRPRPASGADGPEYSDFSLVGRRRFIR